MYGLLRDCRAMRTQLTVAAAAIALLTSGCGTEDEAERAASPTPVATAETIDAKELPGTPGPLEAGTYKTSRFRPGLELTVGEGWKTLSAETGASFTLMSEDAEAGNPIFAIVRPQRVIDPDAKVKGQELPDEAYLPVPEDYVKFFLTHPLLDAGKVSDVKIGDVTGKQFDTTVKKVRNPQCGPGCSFLMATAEQPFSHNEGMRIRNYVFEKDGQQIGIGVLLSDPGKADAAFALSDEIVASIEFVD